MPIYDARKGNAQKSTALDPKLIKVTIPFVTQQHWAALERVFLPAALGGKISDQLFWSKIPGVDVDEELRRRDERSNVKPPPKAGDALDKAADAAAAVARASSRARANPSIIVIQDYRGAARRSRQGGALV